jgi:hypothetical protein
MNKPNYYAIIPAEVRYSKDLTPNAKLLYAEITALSQKDGSCWASNKYFSELYNVTTVTISRLISSLVENGFIIRNITYKKGTKEIDKRYLQLCSEGINNIDNTPINKIVKDNNTSINNTSINNISNRRNEFVLQVMSFDYDKNILNEFIDYWTEPNKSNTKMKFELNATWDTNLRLKKWAKNKQEWDVPKTKKEKPTISKLDWQINEWQKGKKLL